MANDNEEAFVYGRELLFNEFALQNAFEQGTLQLLGDGKLGQKAPVIFERVGDALSLLTQLASCAWGCRGTGHLEEFILRRVINFALGAIRLSLLGLHNEALGLIRGMGELVNLIFLFVLKPEKIDEWKSLAGKARYNAFRPKTVRDALASQPEIPMDNETYGRLCEVAIHVSPQSANLKHSERVAIGAEFGPTGLLIILNEVGFLLRATLKLSVPFLQVDGPNALRLNKASDELSSTLSHVRFADYEAWLNRDETCEIFASGDSDTLVSHIKNDGIMGICIPDKTDGNWTLYVDQNCSPPMIPLFSNRYHADRFIEKLPGKIQKRAEVYTLKATVFQDNDVSAASIVLDFGSNHQRVLTHEEVCALV